MANNTKVIRLIIVSICVAIAITTSVSALSNFNIDQFSQNDFTGIVASTTYLGQTFTLSEPWRDSIGGIGIGLRKVGSPGTLYVDIYKASGGYPTGSVLATQSVSSSAVSTGDCGAYPDIWFSFGYYLPNPDDANYVFVIRTPGASGSNYYKICEQSTSVYAGGNEIYSSNSGSSWSSWPSDIQFELDSYYNADPIPAPTLSSPANGATGVAINATLSWSTVADVDGDAPVWYKVYTSTGPDTFLTCTWGTTASCTPTGLQYNTTYTWSVIAQDNWCRGKGYSDACGSGTSSQRSFTTTTAPVADITSITNLTAIGISTDYIQWNWTNPSDPKYDHVIVYKNGAWVANVTNASHGINFLYLNPNTNYTISTRSVSTDGVINSTWVNATTSTMVECGISEVCHLLYQGVNPYHWFVGNTFKIPAGSAPTVTINSIQMVIYKIYNYNMSYATPCVTIYDLDTGDSVGGGCGESHENIPDINESGKWIFALMDDVVVQTDKYYVFLLTAGDVENGMYVVGVGNHTFPPYGVMAWSDNGMDFLYDNNSNANYIMAYTYNPLYDELYVAKNGNDGNLGTSWGESWLNLYTAVNNINNSGTIHIGYGDYSSQSSINGSISTGYMLWCDSTGYQENVSEPWCDMPGVS